MTAQPQVQIAGQKPGIYIASPAGVRSRAAHWRSLRASGVPMTSTWIDESSAVGTPQDQWLRIHKEIAAAVGVILCIDTGDITRNEPLVEAALALGMRKPVAILLYGLKKGFVLDQALGTWVYHPLVSVHNEFQEALMKLRQYQMPAPAARPPQAPTQSARTSAVAEAS